MRRSAVVILLLAAGCKDPNATSPVERCARALIYSTDDSAPVSPETLRAWIAFCREQHGALGEEP